MSQRAKTRYGDSGRRRRRSRSDAAIAAPRIPRDSTPPAATCPALVVPAAGAATILIDKHSHLHWNMGTSHREPAMYVCVCNAVTESAVRAAACAGVRDLDGLAAQTGCGAGCGCCREFAAGVLAEHVQAQCVTVPAGSNVLPFRQVA
jgi:bacterioferritin-associated ferredoxin